MTRRFDVVGQSFAAAADSAGAWAYISRYAAVLDRPLSGEDGYDEAELDATEGRLGIPLPDAMRAAYRLFGRRDDLTCGQDWFLGPEGLRIDDDGPVLVFRLENQYVAEWGVPLGPGTPSDPPVVFRRVDTSGPMAGRWTPFLDRFSVACVEMVLSESVLSDEARCDNRDLDEATVAVLERRFVRLGIPDYPMYVDPEGAPVRWFSDGSAVLRDDGRRWVWVRAPTVERLDRIRRVLGGDWLMAED